MWLESNNILSHFRNGIQPILIQEMLKKKAALSSKAKYYSTFNLALTKNHK